MIFKNQDDKLFNNFIDKYLISLETDTASFSNDYVSVKKRLKCC